MNQTLRVPWFITYSHFEHDFDSPRYSTFKLVRRYVPRHRISICNMGHCAYSASVLWAKVQDLLSTVGHFTNQILLAAYQRAYGHVSKCMWSCIYINFGSLSTCIRLRIWVVMYPHAHGFISMCKIWLCGKGQSAGFHWALWVTAQNFVIRYGPQRRSLFYAYGPQHRISLSTMGHGAESMTTVQNQWPQRRITQNSFKSLPQS